jgi:mercuric ion transport protein
MSDKGLLGTAAPSMIAVICCLTPALVLGAVGLSAWLGWLEYMLLLPALILFLGVTASALIRIQRAKAKQTRPTEAR